MALIAMAVYDTEENQRSEMTEKTLWGLRDTLVKGIGKHRLIIIDNNSCEKTKEILQKFLSFSEMPAMKFNIKLITNTENVGTAKAINQAWKLREPGEHLIKMDNDVVIHKNGWIDELEQAIARQPKIGIIGLKRKDLAEHPNYPIGHQYKSNLLMLPHVGGQPWIVVEEVQHVMGTCQMYNSALIDKIGGMYQMDGIYGFDDSLAAIRCRLAGFTNVFLPHIDIDHIDPGTNEYSEWKRQYAAEHMETFSKVKQEYISGTRDKYYPLD